MCGFTRISCFPTTAGSLTNHETQGDVKSAAFVERPSRDAVCANPLGCPHGKLRAQSARRGQGHNSPASARAPPAPHPVLCQPRSVPSRWLLARGPMAMAWASGKPAEQTEQGRYPPVQRRTGQLLQKRGCPAAWPGRSVHQGLWVLRAGGPGL